MRLEILLLILAFLWDRALGEPPHYIHPVVWYGKIIERMERRYVNPDGISGIIGGILFLLVLFLFSLIIAFFVEKLKDISIPLFILLYTYFLKSTFSMRSLEEHALESISGGIQRDKVAMMVSRDVSELGKTHLSSAVIESLGDNIVDGFVAPLFYFLLFGLPGTLVYRAINTLDAMIGYRNEKYEWLGKVPARTDDILNFIPARISAIIILILYPHALRCFKKFRSVKLNAGNPMSALAGALKVKLEKKGHYSIPCGKNPDENDVLNAIKVVRITGIAYLILTISIMLLMDFNGIWVFQV